MHREVSTITLQSAIRYFFTRGTDLDEQFKGYQAQVPFSPVYLFVISISQSSAHFHMSCCNVSRPGWAHELAARKMIQEVLIIVLSGFYNRGRVSAMIQSQHTPQLLSLVPFITLPSS